jgi:hypothetical protein
MMKQRRGKLVERGPREAGAELQGFVKPPSHIQPVTFLHASPCLSKRLKDPFIHWAESSDKSFDLMLIINMHSSFRRLAAHVHQRRKQLYCKRAGR